MGDLLNVQPSRRDIGRHQHVELPAFKAAHRSFTCVLRHVALQGHRVDAALDEFLGETLGAVLGASENDCGDEGVVVQQMTQEVELAAFVDRVQRMVDGLGPPYRTYI